MPVHEAEFTFRDDPIERYLGQAMVDRAAADLEAYFGGEPSSGRRGFTGASFEEMADSRWPDRITERDLVAVTMLGVSVPGSVALWMLGREGQHEIGSLLGEMPTT